MHKFVRNLITEWRKLELPFSDNSVVVGVSGGADSMSLLTAIRDLTEQKKLRLRVVVAHFNHKLRGTESDADEEFVRRYAADIGFEFAVASVRIATKSNLEEVARQARYEFLDEVARKYDAGIVLTAHTQNDQAETFLLNLIRGSGRQGLAGMRSIRQLGDKVRLVRPLLSWAVRSDTETFCDESGVAYRSDLMNDDERFARVRIRKTVLPMLAEMNPRIVEALARTAELLADEDVPTGLIPAELTIRELKSLPKAQLYSVLRSWLRSHRGTTRALERKHIEALERLISSEKSGRIVELPGRGRVIKRGGRLAFSKIEVEK